LILSKGKKEMEKDSYIKEPILSKQSDETRHLCCIPVKQYMYGAAINECFEDDEDYLFVCNGEYGSQVNYCPLCGYEAKKKIEE